MTKTENILSNIKARSSQKPVKHKSKDKPKRPLSAYNYFFSDERKKIIIAINCDDDTYRNEIDPCLTKEQFEKLKAGSSKDKFETIGKLIGSRWRNINDEKTAHYDSLAESDKKRYASELETYKQRNQYMRQEPTLFTGNNYVYPQEQYMVPPYMQSRPSTMDSSHMGYMPSYSNGSGYGRMPIMASPNHCYMPSHPANYDHYGHYAHIHNARHANEVRYDSRDEYNCLTSSSQPGHYPSYSPHASRNEQLPYEHQHQVATVHLNAPQLQHPSSSTSTYEQTNFH